MAQPTDDSALSPHLTERELLILQLHYADGWSLRRIARSIGCSYSSVWRSHETALRHLEWATWRVINPLHLLRIRADLVGHLRTLLDRDSDEP